MKIILLLLLTMTSAYAARESVIDADCLRIKDGTCIDKLELGYLDGTTSVIQTQLNSKAATLTNSSGLAGQLTDETGTGFVVFGTSPNITAPTGITKGDVGLGNVDNTSDAIKDAAVATLTNKTLTSPVINSPTGIIKADVGLGSVDNTSDSTKNAATVSLTNKTIDADLNTITNIENADIKAAAAIDASKLGDGTVSTIEYQYINSLSSNAQTQISAKVTGPGSSTDSEIALFDSTTGKLIKAATGTGFVKATLGAYSTAANINLATDVSATILPLANGGSAKNMTAVNGGIVWTDTDSMEVIAAGTSGQILKSNGAAAPSWITSSATVKTCYYSFGGASATLASPTECTTGTCVEVYDSCGTGTPPSLATTALYENLTFAAGTFANSTSVYCKCVAFDISAVTPRVCDPYFDTSDSTWSSNASGGFVINMIGNNTSGTQSTAFVSLKCEGQSP